MDFGPESIAPEEPIPLDDRDNGWDDLNEPSVGGQEDASSNEGDLFQHFLGDERTSGCRAYVSKQGPSYREHLA
jgi:hypothetical protein